MKKQVIEIENNNGKGKFQKLNEKIKIVQNKVSENNQKKKLNTEKKRRQDKQDNIKKQK